VAVLFEPPAQLTVANWHLGRPTAFDPSAILPKLDGRLAGFVGAAATHDNLAPGPLTLAPAEVRVFTGTVAEPIVTARQRDPGATGRVNAAAAASRVAIEAIQPCVDAGRFATKRVVG